MKFSKYRNAIICFGVVSFPRREEYLKNEIWSSFISTRVVRNGSDHYIGINPYDVIVKRVGRLLKYIVANYINVIIINMSMIHLCINILILLKQRTGQMERSGIIVFVVLGNKKCNNF